jgi:hypothetical protein
VPGNPANHRLRMAAERIENEITLLCPSGDGAGIFMQAHTDRIARSQVLQANASFAHPAGDRRVMLGSSCSSAFGPLARKRGDVSRPWDRDIGEMHGTFQKRVSLSDHGPMTVWVGY